MNPIHVAAGPTRFFFFYLPVFSASSTAVRNSPQRSLCSAVCGGAARLRSQSLEGLRQEQGCQFKISLGYIVKPRYKTISIPMISVLSSFVTRLVDGEGTGEEPHGLCEPGMPQRRGQAGRPGGRASLSSLLNAVISPSSKHHPELCSPHTRLCPMRPPSKRLHSIQGAPDDLSPSPKVSLHDQPSGDISCVPLVTLTFRMSLNL